jgi:hypothetical protein
MRSRDILCKAKGDHFDRVHSDQMFVWSLLSGAKSLKTYSKDFQARVHSNQMVLMIAWQEADPCQRRLNSRAILSEDTQMRVGKQL